MTNGLQNNNHDVSPICGLLKSETALAVGFGEKPDASGESIVGEFSGAAWDFAGSVLLVRDNASGVPTD